nr:hypothetical protein [Kibdelosporangium aridum]
MAALSNADELPVHLSNHHQPASHSSIDHCLVPPPADLFIGSLRTDQRRVVGSDVRVAEPANGRDIIMVSIPQDRFDSRGHGV